MDIYLTKNTSYHNKQKIIPIHLPLQISKKGIKQAQKIGHFLHNRNIASIYTSPIKRAIQTAEIINEHLNAPLIPSANFAQVKNSKLQGQSMVHRSQYIFNFGGSETIKSLQKRLLLGLKTIISTQKNSLVVSHSDTIALLLSKLTNQPLPHKPQPQLQDLVTITKLSYVNQDLTGWKNIII